MKHTKRDTSVISDQELLETLQDAQEALSEMIARLTDANQRMLIDNPEMQPLGRVNGDLLSAVWKIESIVDRVKIEASEG